MVLLQPFTSLDSPTPLPPSPTSPSRYATHPPTSPGLFIYEISSSYCPQLGVVGVSSVADYLSGAIKPHEKTVASNEDALVRSLCALSAHTTPVQIAYRNSAVIDNLAVWTIARSTCARDIRDADGVRHRVWRAADVDAAALVAAFEDVGVGYIADGHHRTAAAARVAAIRGEGAGSFLAAWFPERQLHVRGFHRVVRDLGGVGVADFVARVSSVGEVQRIDAPEGDGVPGIVCMYVGGSWYSVDLRKVRGDGCGVVGEVDYGRLQARLLGPLLGIIDPRRDDRLEFVGSNGSWERLTDRLKLRVDSRGDGVAFQMCPVAIKQLMDVADSGALMPPKSTWFTPKLANNLFVQRF